MTEITKICAMEIIDSRGNPTVEAEVTLSDGTRLKINGIVDRVDTYEKDVMKSISIRLVFSAMDRTLEMEEVQGWIDSILANLGNIGVTLRA